MNLNINHEVAQDHYALEVLADYLEEKPTAICDQNLSLFLRTWQHEERGFSDSKQGKDSGSLTGDGFGYGDGEGGGFGSGYGFSYGDGYGDSYGFWDGDGCGDGFCYGDYGDSNGDGVGDGDILRTSFGDEGSQQS
jgi:hypothetical protein